jgi:hypothetical protein
LRSPDDLRDAFHELRADEQRKVPPFRLAQTKASAPHYFRFAVALLLLLVIGAAILIRRQQPARQSLPQSISTWKAPTDFLLQTPESKLLRTVPAFGLPKKGTSS